MRTGIAWVVVCIMVAAVVTFGLIACGSKNSSDSASNNNSGTLTLIAVTPVDSTIEIGQTQQFTATGTYLDNTTQNITGSVTWSSSDTNKATLSNAFNAGLATAVAVGATTITATSGSITGTTMLISSSSLQNFSIEGHVYVTGTTTPIPGAVVSTSLDNQTTTTDTNGLFFLQTITPVNNSVYTITISATGYKTFSKSLGWGGHPIGQDFYLSH